jgi:hypothetical protein
MATAAEIAAAKLIVDTDITNKTAESSVTAVNVGTNIKGALDLTLSPSKIYAAIINQTGTGAPTATVLVNQLGGTPVFARTNTGRYSLTITGAFVASKTLTDGKRCIEASVTDTTAVNVNVFRGDNNIILIETQNEFNYADDILVNFPLKIEVYN